MYFPWVGMLEQVRLSDTFVFYEDVQFSRGGFSNRVQIKTNSEISWLTVPLQDFHLGQLINEVKVNNRSGWQRSQRDFLRQTYAKAPYKREMLKLVDEVFSRQYETLADLSKASTMALIRYFGLENGRTFIDSESLEIPGYSTQRVIDICLHLYAKTYLTGHGARNYLEHARFESNNVDVVYIDYGLQPYPQNYGGFTPYVSSLDLVAQCGKDGVDLLKGNHIPWRQFVNLQNEI